MGDDHLQADTQVDSLCRDQIAEEGQVLLYYSLAPANPWHPLQTQSGIIISPLLILTSGRQHVIRRGILYNGKSIYQQLSRPLQTIQISFCIQDSKLVNLKKS